MRHGIAIERDYLKQMAGQRQFNVLGRAAVQNVEQDPLAFLHADRFAMAERLAVYGEALVPDLPSVGFGLLVFFLLARLLGRRNVGVVHLLFGSEEGFPLMRGEED